MRAGRLPSKKKLKKYVKLPKTSRPRLLQVLRHNRRRQFRTSSLHSPAKQLRLQLSRRPQRRPNRQPQRRPSRSPLLPNRRLLQLHPLPELSQTLV